MVTEMQSQPEQAQNAGQKPPLNSEDQHDPFVSRRSRSNDDYSWDRWETGGVRG
tara:strand:+ start:758 stop:919 length:162 start_codon:yes stop_codon:yes gene_type:complete